MIDIESKVFNEVALACRAIFPNCGVSGEYVMKVASYPHVEFSMTDNYVHDPSVSLDKRENHAHIAFEAVVYSNLQNGKKLQAKKIMSAIDEVMASFGFVRRMMSQIPNIDNSVYRLTARWEGIVSAGEEINGNTVHKVYNL